MVTHLASRYLLRATRPASPFHKSSRKSGTCIRAPKVLRTNRIGVLQFRRGQAGAHCRNGHTHWPAVDRGERTCGGNASICMQASRHSPVRTRTSYIAGIAEPIHPIAAGNTSRNSSAGSARGLSSRNRDKSASHQPRSQPANHPQCTVGDSSYVTQACPVGHTPQYY